MPLPLELHLIVFAQFDGPAVWVVLPYRFSVLINQVSSFSNINSSFTKKAALHMNAC